MEEGGGKEGAPDHRPAPEAGAKEATQMGH